MDMNIFYQILLSLFFIALNGFFVLAEFGIVKVRHTQLNDLVSRGNRKAKLAQEVTGKLDYYLNACQLGSTISSIGLGWIGEPVVAKAIEGLLPGIFADRVLHVISFLTAFAVISYLHIVLGELVPKSIAIRKPLLSALYSAPSLYYFAKVFFLPLTILNKSSNGILRLLGVPPEMSYHMAYSEEELRAILAESQSHGVFSLNRLFLTENALNFGKLTAANAMTSAEKIETLYADKPWEENNAIINRHKRTRYPVCQGSSDRILGYIHLKDFVTSGKDYKDNGGLKKILRPIFFIRPELPLEDLLREFQDKKAHIAIVRGGKDKVLGLVTFEDIIEELIGEVRDEFTAEAFTNLSDLIKPEGIITSLEEDSKEAILGKLASKAAEVYRGLHSDELLSEALKRESLISTAIGSGIAIPHARVEIQQPVVIFARSGSGLEFDAPDGLPVKLFFFVITPISTPVIQLRVLAKIAKVAESSIFRQKLLEAGNEEAIMNVIKTADRAYSIESSPRK